MRRENVLKFRVPRNNVFFLIKRGFQLRLLKLELNKAREITLNLYARADMSQSKLCWALNEKLLGSVELKTTFSLRKIR